MRHRQIKNLRWVTASLLFLATVVNYLDRQVLSVVAPMLRKDLRLSNTEYAYAINAFLIAYGIMYVVGGRIIDLLNTRRGLALSLAIWSLASLCHTFIVGLWDLCFYRFLLGAAEPGNFTASVKAVSAWFPIRERGIAIGFVFSGTGIGAVVAPPLTLWIALHFGWRMAFLLTSLSGVFWLLLWLPLYQEPQKHRWITQRELQHILSDRTGETETKEEGMPGWSKLAALPQSWSFLLARFFCDPLGYFYWFWIPSYLAFVKGFSFELLAKWLWVPYLFQGLGQIAGGHLSGMLIRQGMAPLLARKLTISVAFVLTPVAVLSLTSSQTSGVILYISVATFGIGWWGANYNSLLMDNLPHHVLASVAGLAGSAGSVGSVIVTWLTGYAADHNAYQLIFVGNCVLMAFSIASTWALLRRPVQEQQILP